jgi:glycosyltransferase involved in cell wall biosynthesis
VPGHRPQVRRTPPGQLLGLGHHVERLLVLARVGAAEAMRHDAVDLGDLLDDLRRQLAPLGRRARFLGWRPDVETVYAAADVVVLTSDNEGMPVSLIEAATVGRAAVTTDVGSAREVVLDGRTGFVTTADAAALADATGRLLDDAELRGRMEAAAAEHAATSFSRQRLVDDMAAIYEELAGRNRARLARRDGWTNT